EAGLVNHYYAFELRRQDPSLSVENHFFRPGDPGNLINVAGVGIINSERTRHAGRRLVDFLLSVRAQSYFSAETFEYPLAAGVAPDPLLPPLESIGSPDIDLSDLAGLQETVAMLKETGLL
ncbi:MAG: iron ABC transporter substrate-binding protein, partial [Actinomycetota bacterium]